MPPKKIVFKKKKKNNFIELTYDNKDKDKIKSKSINFELVNDIINLINLKNPEVLNEDNFSIPNNCKEKITDDNDIDYDLLIKDYIGGKIIYFDHEKSIIYDENYNIIGSIREDDLIFSDESYNKEINNLENNMIL